MFELACILFFIALLVTGVAIDTSTMLFIAVVYLLGITVATLFNKTNRKDILRIYTVLFAFGCVYMIACYLYMTYHNYEYLLAYDTWHSFHPIVERYLSLGTFTDALEVIWTDYNFFNRFQYGYFTYATAFAYLGEFFGTNFYIGQNLSVLILFPLVGILLYRLLKINYIAEKQAKKYSLIICLFSIIFFYSFQTLRDLHILLMYLSAIYITFKSYSLKNLLLIVLLCIICSTFRIESGLFLFVLVPIYLLISFKNSRSVIWVSACALLLMVGAFMILVPQLDSVLEVFDKNQEYYVEDVDKSSGIIGTLQRIPVLGDLLSIIYNAFQPVPFWSRWYVGRSAMLSLGGATYNIMNFPTAFASFFNCIVIVFVSAWLLYKPIRKSVNSAISLPMRYHLWVGLIFLYLQSAVIAQRRLMGYYCLFYVFFYVIWTNIDRKVRQQLCYCSIVLFFLLQIVGIFMF